MLVAHAHHKTDRGSLFNVLHILWTCSGKWIILEYMHFLLMLVVPLIAQCAVRMARVFVVSWTLPPQPALLPPAQRPPHLHGHPFWGI